MTNGPDPIVCCVCRRPVAHPAWPDAWCWSDPADVADTDTHDRWHAHGFRSAHDPNGDGAM